MIRRELSPQLKIEIENKITELEAEDKYFKDFLDDMHGQNVSSTEDGKTDQQGTSIPRYFGAMNTYIANPSNVGIGIISRMIETDDTVSSSVQFKSLMMLSKIGEYQHPNSEIEDFVRGFISAMRDPSWKQSLEAMSSSGGYGFSITEIMWGLNKVNQKVPMRLKTYHPSTLAFEVDPYGDVTADGVIQFIIQNSQISNPNSYAPYFQYGFTVKNPFETPVDRLLPHRIPFISNYGLARIPRNKVVHHINNSMMSFGSPYGKNPVRTAHLAWQLKVFFMKQMGIAGKRNASPFVWGTAPRTVNKDRVQQDDGSYKDFNPIEALKNILSRREADDAVVTGPEKDGYSLTAITQQTSMDQYLNVIDHLNTYIFRCFLLPSLVMTDGSAGSRSLGDKHFQVVDRIAEDDAQTFGQTVINQLIKPAIDMNFGEQEDYGHFAQRPQNIEERERLANVYNTLATAGYVDPRNKNTNDFVTSTLHLPENDESFYTTPMPNFDPIPNETDPDDASGEVDDNGATDESLAALSASVSPGDMVEILYDLRGGKVKQGTKAKVIEDTAGGYCRISVDGKQYVVSKEEIKTVH